MVPKCIMFWVFNKNLKKKKKEKPHWKSVCQVFVLVWQVFGMGFVTRGSARHRRINIFMRKTPLLSGEMTWDRMCAWVSACTGRQGEDGWRRFSGPCGGQAALLTQWFREGRSRSAISVRFHVDSTSRTIYLLKVSWTDWVQYCLGCNLCCKLFWDVPVQTGNMMLSGPAQQESRGVMALSCPSPCARCEQVGWVANWSLLYGCVHVHGCQIHLEQLMVLSASSALCCHCWADLGKVLVC